MLCECCGSKEARVKDYRESYNQLSSYYVCLECLHRSDASFWAKMSNKAKRSSKR